MKQKKLTKRQVLNELLVANDVAEKIEASRNRLDKREEKLIDKVADLTDQLIAICDKDVPKIGGHSRLPIIFKNHIFTPSAGSMYSSSKCYIESVTNVK